ncbi:hypothetical protein DH2020_030835 [Rehmannia glutinosa]|uniref:Phytocyanin domain-containing protein n=1 Tax=Rehmannia glutinosa TaxID=99300 RepID=A0ABR0VMK0_REHGL
MVVAILLLGLLLHGSPAHAANYTVGDSSGWTFYVAGWENGKNFKAGDTLGPKSTRPPKPGATGPKTGSARIFKCIFHALVGLGSKTRVFKYSPTAHDVVVVDKSSYDSCSVPANATTYNSGNDEISLRKGANYFICSIPGHCQPGRMKIAANAA